MFEKPLYCIVCGFERGGTTLIAELIRQHPKVDGRFEGGFLLAETIADFVDLEPYASNVKRFWHISQESLEYICQAPSWQNAYKRLIERSDIPNKSVSVYDKTPKYMQLLKTILKKVHVPAVCVVRDPRALYWSHQKRWQNDGGNSDRKTKDHRNNQKRSVLLGAVIRLKRYLRHRHILSLAENFSRYYVNYGKGWRDAQDSFGDRILLVQHEQLCTNPLKETKRIFDFLGLAFEDEYVYLPQTDNPYVARGGISVDVVREYQSGLPRRFQNELLEKTKEFSFWHWDS